MKHFEQIYPVIMTLFGIVMITGGVVTGNLGTAISGLMLTQIGLSISSDVYVREYINQKFEELYKKTQQGG